MRLREITRTRSNPRVAEAALVSIGGDTARRICAQAEESGVAAGELTACLVREFDGQACSMVRASVEDALRRSETPILAGLQRILEHALSQRALARRRQAGDASAVIPNGLMGGHHAQGA